MKTRVEFRSNKFPPREVEKDKINPGVWGMSLAEYLGNKLAEFGIETEEVLIEDWGCLIPVANNSFELWLGCGHQYGDHDVFLCFIEPSKPIFRKLFKKIDTTQEVTRLSQALEKILASDSDIREVRWLSQSER